MIEGMMMPLISANGSGCPVIRTAIDPTQRPKLRTTLILFFDASPYLSINYKCLDRRFELMDAVLCATYISACYPPGSLIYVVLSAVGGPNI